MTISRRFIQSVSILAITGILISAVGCGYDEYERRLNETKKYYAHLERIETSLAPKWIYQGNLMELRVPLQFALIPPPVPTKTEDGRLEWPAIDPRQPDYMNLTLPNLFGAWEASFKVAKGGGETATQKGYIYALTNYWEFVGENPTDAGAFYESLKSMLATTLKIDPFDEPPQVLPKGVGTYQPQVNYEVCSFKGKEINGTNYTFELYKRTNSSIISVIVVVLPEGIDMQQKINERITMMLESFSFTSVAPKSRPTTAAPAAAPTPNKGGF